MNAPVSAVPPLNYARGVVVAPEHADAVMSHESEVLGCLFAFPDRIGDCDGLRPEDFAIYEYGRAFKAMLDAHGQPFGILSIANKSGVHAAVLARTLISRVTLINLVDYVEKIRRAAIMRQSVVDTQKIASDGAAGEPMALAMMYREAAARAEAVSTYTPEIDGAGLGSALLNHMSGLARGENTALCTGLKSLDERIGGWRPGELVVVAARPGMGKTVFAISTARMAAASGERSAGFFSLEVGMEQTAARFTSDFLLATKGVRVPYSAILRDAVWPGSKAAVENASFDLKTLALFTNFDAGITLAALEARLERWKEAGRRTERPLAVVFIDYLKFLKATERYRGNRVLEIGEITGGLKEIAKRQGVCIVLLTQLNRAVEGRDDKRPTLSDLRDSGEIEQDADIVLMLYREAYYLRNPKTPEEEMRLAQVPHDLEVLVEKNRAGECGPIKLWCDVATSSVRDKDAD